jgi:hypothetical protein
MPSTKLELRDYLSEIYGETLAEEFTLGISSYTLENMIQEELDRLDGPVVGKYRHALIPYLTNLKDNLATNIEKIKQIPPEKFVLTGDPGGEVIDEEEEA